MTKPVAILVAASSLLSAQQGPAVRQLGPAQATSAESFSDQSFVRHLKGGGVLVNDIRGRKVVRLDDKLAVSEVVADSTPATATAYSGRTGMLVPYRGDSSLFIDAASMSMLVIDQGGKMTSRVMSIPRTQDAQVLGNTIGNANFDPAGRLVYRSQARPNFQMGRPANPGAAGAAGAPTFAMPEIPDSAAVVRMNIATRMFDTVGFVKTPKIKMEVTQMPNGGVSMSSLANPLPLVDDWAVLSDGSVAMIRGRDYHVDFVRPDGTKESAAKMPFDWQRLTDDDKRAFIDSVKAYREKLLASMPQGAGAPNVAGGAAPGGPGAAGGAGQQRMVMQFGDGGGGGGGGGRGGPDGGRQQMQIGGPGGPGGPAGGMTMNFVPPEELPDYKPPFFAGAARADAEGRIWIRTIPTKAIAGGWIYDVINGKGELVERVQVPVDRTIVGFGSGGVVYLRVGATSKLERASYK